ncbi:MAG: hypothetical protein ACOCV1_05785 [Bacillota bacterium]
MNEKTVVCTVKDLGVAAFMKMKGYKIYSRRGREFEFEILEEEQERFEKEQVEYINSPFSAFDNEIMNLKKIPDRK